MLRQSALNQRAAGFADVRPRTVTTHQRGERHRPSSAPIPPPPTEEKTDTRFRWNPAQSRWERVKAARDKDGKYKLDKWKEGGVSTIQTKSGSSYVVWPVIHSWLTEHGLKSVTPEEAQRLQKEEDAIFVDPRVDWDFEKQHIEGAVSVPLYRGVAGKSAWDTMKRAVMAVGFAMRATERNPAFKETAEDRLPKNKKLILYCGLGGTLEVGAQPYKPGGKSFKDDPERMFGRESRSLKACYELLQVCSLYTSDEAMAQMRAIFGPLRQMFRAGYTDVVHLKGGLSQWRFDGFPVE